MSFGQGFVHGVFGQEMPDAVADFEDQARGFAKHHLVNDNMPADEARAVWGDLRQMRRAAGPGWVLDPGHHGLPTMRPK